MRRETREVESSGLLIESVAFVEEQYELSRVQEVVLNEVLEYPQSLVL